MSPYEGTSFEWDNKLQINKQTNLNIKRHLCTCDTDMHDVFHLLKNLFVEYRHAFKLNVFISKYFHSLYHFYNITVLNIWDVQITMTELKTR